MKSKEPRGKRAFVVEAWFFPIKMKLTKRLLLHDCHSGRRGGQTEKGRVVAAIILQRIESTT